MFCDRCGAPLQPNQRFCGQCGRDFAGAAAAAQFGPNRVQEHLRFIGILWLALGVLSAVGAIVLLILGNALFPHLHEFAPVPPDMPVGFLRSLFCFLGVAFLIKAALSLLAGYGLLQRESWARMLTMVLSFVALLNFPLGTALGIYSLWVLLPQQSEREYQQEVARAATAQ